MAVLLGSAVLAFVVTLGMQPLLIRHLGRRGVLDRPNERSSHLAPTPRGGGIGILTATAAVALTWRSSQLMFILLPAMALGLIGLIDDLRTLTPRTRLLLQTLIGTFAAFGLVADTEIAWVAVPLVAFWTVGFVNAFNFMDGINGISGLTALVAGVTFTGLGAQAADTTMVVAGLTVAATALGFLPYNLRGRVFLGDVGSYLLGALIAITAAYGILSGLPALIVLSPTLIYLLDTSYTLTCRWLSGEPIMQPHRSHRYQQLHQLGWSHGRTAAWVASCEAATVGAAFVYVRLSLVPGCLLLILVPVAYLAAPRLVGGARIGLRRPAPPISKADSPPSVDGQPSRGC